MEIGESDKLNINNNSFTQWVNMGLISAEEIGDTVEMVWKERLNYWSSTSDLSNSVRVYKVIYSCKDGKWHKSDRIYGKVIPAKGETYEF